MAGVSKIKRLPKAIQQAINTWFEAGYTLDEITQHLKTVGTPISRSALGRRRQSISKVNAKIKESQEIAEAIAKSFKDAPESESANANYRMMHALLQNFLYDMLDKEQELKPAELLSLSKALASLSTSRKAEVSTAIAAEKAIVETGQDTEESNNNFEIVLIDPKQSPKK